MKKFRLLFLALLGCVGSFPAVYTQETHQQTTRKIHRQVDIQDSDTVTSTTESHEVDVETHIQDENGKRTRVRIVRFKSDGDDAATVIHMDSLCAVICSHNHNCDSLMQFKFGEAMQELGPEVREEVRNTLMRIEGNVHEVVKKALGEVAPEIREHVRKALEEHQGGRTVVINTRSEEDGNSTELNQTRMVFILTDDQGQEQYLCDHRAGAAMEEAAPFERFTVYPNPNEGTFRMRFQVPEDEDQLELRVTDSQGRTLMEETIKPESSLYERDIELPEHAKGPVFIHLTGANHDFRFKVLTQ